MGSFGDLTLTQESREFASQGSHVMRLSKTEPSQRYLWIDVKSLELRWSKSGPSEPRFKAAKLSEILRVRRVASVKKPIYAFQVETLERKTVYRVDSLRKRELWVAALSMFTKKRSASTYETKENADSPFVMGRSSASFVLSEIRGAANSASMSTSVPVLMATAKLLFTDDGSQKILESLPYKLEETISAKRRRIIELQNKIDSACDIGDLIEAFKRAKYAKQIGEVSDRRKQLAEDIQRMELENTEVEARVREYETAISQAEAEEVVLTSKLPTNAVLANPANISHLRLLRYGVVAQVCCIVSDDSDSDFTISPHRPHENGVYKRRVVSCSPDYSHLIMHSLNFFNKKHVSLPVSEVSEVVAGLVDPDHGDFPDFNYVTLKTTRGLVIIATERLNICDNLKILCGQQVPTDSHAVQYLSSAEQLNSQLKIYRRILSRYRSNLEESLCCVARGMPTVKHIYESVLLNLRLISEVEATTEDWLRAERLNLTIACQSLNSVIAALHMCLR